MEERQLLWIHPPQTVYEASHEACFSCLSKICRIANSSCLICRGPLEIAPLEKATAKFRRLVLRMDLNTTSIESVLDPFLQKNIPISFDQIFNTLTDRPIDITLTIKVLLYYAKHQRIFIDSNYLYRLLGAAIRKNNIEGVSILLDYAQENQIPFTKDEWKISFMHAHDLNLSKISAKILYKYSEIFQNESVKTFLSDTQYIARLCPLKIYFDSSNLGFLITEIAQMSNPKLVTKIITNILFFSKKNQIEIKEDILNTIRSIVPPRIGMQIRK